MKTGLVAAADALWMSLETCDEAAASGVLDGLVGWYGADVVAAELVPLVLRVFERRLERRQISQAQHDFARGFLEAGLFRLARGWAEGEGPRALLASAPGAARELRLVAFGLALRRRGWRISYLGCEVSFDAMIDAARLLGPRLAVVALADGMAPEDRGSADLRVLAACVPLALLGGAHRLASSIGARTLGRDLIAEARHLTASAVAPIG